MAKTPTNTPIFDTYVMVDWSARNKPTRIEPKEDAIWWAVQTSADSWKHRERNGAVLSDRLEHGVFYERTRSDLVTHLSAFVSHEVEAGRRVLLGFDFAFGYPKRFLDVIREACDDFPPCDPTAMSAFSMWKWLSGHIEDDRSNKKNDNNRFDVAERMNQYVAKKCDVPGPFYGSGMELKKSPYKQARGKEDPWPIKEFGFDRKRTTDVLAVGAQEIWKLSGVGSVGSQALLGIPRLHDFLECLRAKHGLADGRCSVWPFDMLSDGHGLATSLPKIVGEPYVVVAEIYPSLITRGRCDPIPDRSQVLENAKAFETLDARGQLAPLFDLRTVRDNDGREVDLDQSTILEEGWILGVGRVDIVQSVVKPDSPLYRPPMRKNSSEGSGQKDTSEE